MVGRARGAPRTGAPAGSGSEASEHGKAVVGYELSPAAAASSGAEERDFAQTTLHERRKAIECFARPVTSGDAQPVCARAVQQRQRLKIQRRCRCGDQGAGAEPRLVRQPPADSRASPRPTKANREWGAVGCGNIALWQR